LGDIKIEFMKNVNRVIVEKLERKIREIEAKRVKGFLDGRKEPRRTIQVSIWKKWHEELKKEALVQKKTMSKLLDKIVLRYFN